MTSKVVFQYVCILKRMQSLSKSLIKDLDNSCIIYIDKIKVKDPFISQFSKAKNTANTLERVINSEYRQALELIKSDIDNISHEV